MADEDAKAGDEWSAQINAYLRAMRRTPSIEVDASP
jgi:hypothetical protein